MSEPSFTPALPLADLPAGSKQVVTLAGVPILLCHTADRVFAVRNECSHARETLDCGRMRGGWIACPVHGARFDLESGEPLNPPATQPIQTFAVRIIDDSIEVAV